MAGNTLQASDIISPDVKKELAEIETRLQAIVNVMVSVSSTSKAMNDTLIKGATTQKETAENVEKVRSATTKLTEAEKAKIQLEQQVLVMQAKISALNTDQGKLNYSIIENYKKQKKAIEDEIKGKKEKINVNEGEAASIEWLINENKNLIKIRNGITTQTEAGRKQIELINKRLDENTNKIKENSSSSEKQRMNIGNYKSALEAMPGPLNSFTSDIGNMTKAVLAFIATPIGVILLILAGIIKSVTAAFSESEEGQNKLTKITTVLGAVLHELIGIFAKVGEAIITAVTEPKKAWESLKKTFEDFSIFFKNSFGKSFTGGMQMISGEFHATIANMKLAWAKFKDLFTENAKGIAEAQLEMAKANLEILQGSAKVYEADQAFRKAWDDIKGAVSDFIEEEKRWADMDAKRRKDERDDLIYFAKLQKEINALRADAEAKKKSEAEVSIALMERAMKLEEEKLQDELSDAKRDLEMWKLKGEFEKKDIAYLDELAKLNANVYTAEAAFEETRRTNTKQLNKLRMEAFSQEKERIKTIADGNKAELNAVLAKNADIISDENSTYKQRISASIDNTTIRQRLIEQEYESQAKEIRKNYEFKLLSEKDASDQLEKIAKEKDEKEVNLAISTDNEIKGIRAKRISDMDREADDETNKLTDLYLQKKIDAQQLADGLLDIQIKQVEAELQLADLSYSQKVALETKLNGLKMSLMDKELKKRQDTTKAIQDLANGLFDFGSMQRDAELQGLEYEKEQKIKAAGDNAKAKERIEKEYAAKEATIKRKQVVADKIQALFNAAINTAVAITAAAKTPLLIPWITALGALQVATIAAKPIPKFATGVKNFAGGQAIVGDAGFEMAKLPNGQIFLTPDVATKMILPKGTDVHTNNETVRELQGGATIQKWDEMLKEQRKTRAALSNKIENNLNITSEGWKYTQRKVNQNVEFVDKYFRC
jgi:hypothetical protein